MRRCARIGLSANTEICLRFDSRRNNELGRLRHGRRFPCRNGFDRFVFQKERQNSGRFLCRRRQGSVVAGGNFAPRNRIFGRRIRRIRGHRIRDGNANLFLVGYEHRDRGRPRFHSHRTALAAFA